MRDKNRIKPFLEKVQEYWEQNPDLRFGQIIYIFADRMGEDDIYFPEEKEWLNEIEELIKEGKQI